MLWLSAGNDGGVDISCSESDASLDLVGLESRQLLMMMWLLLLLQFEWLRNAVLVLMMRCLLLLLLVLLRLFMLLNHVDDGVDVECESVKGKLKASQRVPAKLLTLQQPSQLELEKLDICSRIRRTALMMKRLGRNVHIFFV